MKRATHLGDAHNFGRRVAQRGKWIVKPRPLLWEWALLSRVSPLRRFLGGDFDFLPDLEGFYRDWLKKPL